MGKLLNLSVFPVMISMELLKAILPIQLGCDMHVIAQVRYSNGSHDDWVAIFLRAVH